MGVDDRHQPVDGGKATAGDQPVRVTVTMTRGQHRALKRAARDAGTSVSGLVRVWVGQDVEMPGTNTER